MLETYEDRRLKELYELQDKNTFYYDKYVQYVNFKLHLELEKEVDKLESVVYARQQFFGKPHEWKGNIITLKVCNKCVLSDKCVQYNEYLDIPSRRHCYDQDGFEIHYDKGGNRNQIINLKTGEQV